MRRRCWPEIGVSLWLTRYSRPWRMCAAEHTQRHVGQIVTTAKIVQGLGPS